MIKIAIADDHTYIREGLKNIFKAETDFEFVGEASSSKSVFELLNNNTVDILILDISLPDKNGLEILKELQSSDTNTKVIVLSMYSEDSHGLRALRAGAKGYLSKTAPAEELIKAIRKVSEGRKYISEGLAENMIDLNKLNSNEMLHKNLTEREFQVFIELAQGKTLKEISYSLGLSISTVNTYRRRILDKMHFNSNFDLTHYAIQNNIIE
jgi:two-component system invasion response regulator UvrY